MVDVVVLNYNDAETTKKYVETIYKFPVIDHIVVVDNNSTDGSFEILSTLNNDKIIVINSNHNGGYGFGNNFGIKYAIKHFKSKYIAITNPDVIYTNECLKKCVEFLIRYSKKRFAVVAPIMKDKNGNSVISSWMIPNWIEYTCFSLAILGKIFKLKHVYPNTQSYTDCDCVAGSMLVIDSDSFITVGMYDENIFLYCEETVLGIKLRNARYKTALINDESFIHMHSVSINKSISSVIKQKQIMWNSRLYALKKYYKINGIQYILARLLSWINLLETRIKFRWKNE